ncbi:MAG: hypothetical protein COU67_03095 [Candidatus Pacebacteria bacterium CG10_big_fil_rev_8_21_14_0_10_44_54]|nr:MAG: hypothetical protein COU67_03095 [Candidatus Pacebacteria bacterium CG10_big_fil_rev_8_21_14_0_10_44_54]
MIKRFQNIRPKHFLTGILGVSLVTMLAALLLFITSNPLKQSQDDRSQAAIPEKKAEIKIIPSVSSITVDDQSSFTISGSTGGYDSYGFQFVATIDTTNIKNLALTPKPQSSLAFPVATVTAKSENQSEIVIFATNPTITSPVNISGFQDLAVLSFTAKNKGMVSISPQDTNSKVLDFRSESSLNMLKPMSAASINISPVTTPPTACNDEQKTCPDGTKVGRDPNNSCNFFECPGPAACTTELRTCWDRSQVGRDINNNCEFRACPPQPTPLVCNTQLKTCPDNSTVGRNPDNNCEFYACPSTNNNGTGGYTVSGCNGDCTSNNECAVNLTCYNGKCRLPTNISSASCQNATTNNNTSGALSSCNQYCTNSRDCSTSLVCYYNQCRNPLNVESPSCAAPSVAQNTRPTPTPKPTTTPAKGSALNNFEDSKDATTGAATATPKPSSTPSPDPIFDEPIDQSALGAVQKYLAEFWKNGDRTQVMIVFGLAILMVLGLIALLISLISPKKPRPPTPTHRTPPPTMPPPTLTTQR